MDKFMYINNLNAQQSTIYNLIESEFELYV